MHRMAFEMRPCTHSSAKGFQTQTDSWRAMFRAGPHRARMRFTTQLKVFALGSTVNHGEYLRTKTGYWYLSCKDLVHGFCYRLSGAASSAISEECRLVNVTVYIELQKGRPIVIHHSHSTSNLQYTKSKAVGNYAWKHICMYTTMHKWQRSQPEAM